METRTKNNDATVMDYFTLALDPNDKILECWTKGVGAQYIDDWKKLRDIDTNIPVSFRGMTGRKIVNICKEQGRDFYYVDTGYLGNRQKRKVFHRVVKNGMQHSKVRFDMPDDRWKWMQGRCKDFSYKFRGWKQNGRNILVVTPSEKPCKFYGLDRDTWVKETLATIKKHTDRPIIVRDKGLRHERIGDGSIFNQFDDDSIFATVTYNSIAATESIMYGIPAFTGAPGAADVFCEKDFSKIDNPTYHPPSKVQQWLHWLCYCQFTTDEMISGEAKRIIEQEGIE